MQSRLLSLIEILISTFLGFLVGLFSNIIVLPLFGLHASISDSIWISVIFTLIGIARSYLIRRLFNKFNPMLNKYFKEK